MFDIDDMKDEEEVVTDIDLEPEDAELEDEESLAKDKLKSLRDKLKHSEEERKKCQDDLQRTRADFLNSRKRLDEQLARDKERATDKLIMELLTLADSFDMAMLDTELWEKMDTNLKTGIEAIQAKLSSILKGNNITTISPLGEMFDRYQTVRLPMRQRLIKSLQYCNEDTNGIMTSSDQHESS